MARTASPSERRSYLPPQHDGLGNRIPGTGVYVPFGDPSVSTTTVPQGTLLSGTPVGLFHVQVPTVEYNRARDWAASIVGATEDAPPKGTSTVCTLGSEPSVAMTATVAHEAPAAVHDAPTTASKMPTIHDDSASVIVHGVYLSPASLYYADKSKPDYPFTFGNKNPHSTMTVTWAAFCERMKYTTEGDASLHLDVAKRKRGGFIVGRYSVNVGRQGLATSLIGTNILALDCDDGSPHVLASALSGYASVIHSTYSYTPAEPCCRAFVLLSEELKSAKDYNCVVKTLSASLAKLGLGVPSADTALGKLVYLPMHQRGVEPVYIVTHGRPLDVARILRAAEETTRCTPRSRSSGKGNRNSANLDGAVKHAADKVKEARDGERHNTRFRQAVWLSELGADDDVIISACLDSEADEKAVKTVQDAIVKGRTSSEEGGSP